LADVRRLSTKTPAVLVTILGVPPQTSNLQGGMPVPEVEFGAYIVTRDDPTQSPPLSRHDAAIAYAQGIVSVVSATRFGDGVSVATDVSAEALYTPELDSAGIALWAVTWRHKIDCPPDETAANITPFQQLNSTITVPGTDATVEGIASPEQPS
jgi:hypothetical protein